MTVAYRQKRKEEIFQLLGNKCKHCGEKDERVLQIDHVFSDGAKERKLSRIALYNNVEEKPKRYQLLCANCNWKKRSWEFNPIGRLKPVFRRLLFGTTIALSFIIFVILDKKVL